MYAWCISFCGLLPECLLCPIRALFFVLGAVSIEKGKQSFDDFKDPVIKMFIIGPKHEEHNTFRQSPFTG